MVYKLLLFCLLTSININSTKAYCWQVGWNPSFKGDPKITQVGSTRVRISWKDVIQTKECADGFLVKYSKGSYLGKSYKMSDIVAPESDALELNLIEPGVEYSYQVIAREDKGIVLGVDYNRSPTITFRTQHRFTPKKVNDNKPLNVAITKGHDGHTKFDIKAKIVKPTIEQDSSSPSRSLNVNRGGSVENESAPILPMSLPLMALLMVGGVIGVLIIIGVTYTCFRRIKQSRIASPGTHVQLCDKQDNQYTNQENDRNDKSINGESSSLSESENHRYSSSDTVKANSGNEEKKEEV